MSILHSEKAARTAGHGGSLSSRLPAVLPRDTEDFEVVVAMRCQVGALERYLTANPETRTVMLQHVARDLAAKVERCDRGFIATARQAATAMC